MKKFLLIALLLFVSFCFASFSFAESQKSDEAKKPSPSLTVTSQDGLNSLTFGLAVQLLYQYDQKDQGEDVHPAYSSALRWRRVRPTVSGSFLAGDLDYYLHLSTAPGQLELMDFYINYNPMPYFRVRVGQSKIPFTRYRIQSFKNLQFVDWSMVTKYFGAERQLGVALHDGYEKPMPLEYEVGLYNGMNSRASHGLGIAAVSGEPVGNPSDLVAPAPLDEFHPAVVGHLAYNYNNIVTAYETDFEKTGPRFSIGASSVWDANPTPYRDFAFRAAPEFLFKLYGWAVSANYYMGMYEPEAEMNDLSLAMTGMVANTSYLAWKFMEISARYSAVGTTEDFRNDAGAHAEAILAAAPQEELEALTDQYKNAGVLRSQNEITAGLNFYLIGRNLKLQNDASWITTEDFRGDDLKDFRFRTQLQLTF